MVSRGAEAEWLRRSLAVQLGIENPHPDRSEGMRELYTRLVEIDREGRRCLVLIDEADALDAAGVAELRSWMNLEHEERKLLSLVLVGSLELDEALGDHAGLLDRVEARVELTGFSQDEARTYLEHRLKRVGGHSGIFEDDAYAALADAASGIPRRLNALADNTLFEAHLAGQSPAGIDSVQAAASQLPWAKGNTPAEIASELGEMSDDSLSYVAAAFGPVASVSSDSMGVGETQPDFRLDSGPLEPPDDLKLDVDADDSGSEDSGSEFAADDLPDLAEEFEEADLEAEIESVEDDRATSEAVPPVEDEIEGLFENLVAED